MLGNYPRYVRLASAALLAAACGDQASTAYRGEPLLTFTGSVQLLEGADDPNAVPTLAFEGPGGRWSIMDAYVEGTFPARFTLSVFEPPPEAALADYGALFDNEDPAIAIGYLTASPPDYEASFQNVNSISTTSDCPFDDACRRVRTELCEVTAERADAHDGFDPSYCWAEIRECDFEIDWDLDQSFESCPIVETFGNPDAAERPAARFLGYAHSHAVAYLASPAPKDSFVARLLNQPEGIAAGYHIVESRLRSAAEYEEADRCNDAAAELGAMRYIASHPELRCTYLPGDEHGAGFFDCEDQATQAQLRPGGDVLRAIVELDCPPPGEATMHLVDTASTELEIVVGPRLPDFGFGR